MSEKKGIVLMNLGSPDSTQVKDVRRYLAEFLMDERVIDVPYLLRFLLVRGIIVPFRAPKSAEAYKRIWTEKGSPLVDITKQVQADLQKQTDEPVEIAMRYGNPSPKTAFDILMKKSKDLEEVVLMPMYPHYAMSSYETAVEYAKIQHKQGNYPFKLSIVEPFYKNADYINALVETMRFYTQGGNYDHVLFSYHGIPERHIHKCDITKTHCLKKENCCTTHSPAHAFCYKHQCLETTRLVAEKLGIPKQKYSHSFQSRLGRDKWLEPYTDHRFEEMPKAGIKNLIVVSPAFVSDCLETLEEIAMEGKEQFLEAGGENFTLIPCMNVHPLLIKAIKDLIDK